MVKFEKNSAIKVKKYFLDYILENNKYQPVVIITYNKYIFSINDKILKK